MNHVSSKLHYYCFSSPNWNIKRSLKTYFVNQQKYFTISFFVLTCVYGCYTCFGVLQLTLLDTLMRTRADRKRWVVSGNFCGLRLLVYHFSFGSRKQLGNFSVVFRAHYMKKARLRQTQADFTPTHHNFWFTTYSKKCDLGFLYHQELPGFFTMIG